MKSSRIALIVTALLLAQAPVWASSPFNEDAPIQPGHTVTTGSTGANTPTAITPPTGQAATPETSSTLPATTVKKYRKYTVKSGDSLSAIAAKLLGDPMRYPEIVKLNGEKYPSILKNPDLIYSGWEFDIPEELPAASPGSSTGATPTGTTAAAPSGSTNAQTPYIPVLIDDEYTGNPVMPPMNQTTPGTTPGAAPANNNPGPVDQPIVSIPGTAPDSTVSVSTTPPTDLPTTPNPVPAQPATPQPPATTLPEAEGELTTEQKIARLQTAIDALNAKLQGQGKPAVTALDESTIRQLIDEAIISELSWMGLNPPIGQRWVIENGRVKLVPVNRPPDVPPSAVDMQPLDQGLRTEVEALIQRRPEIAGPCGGYIPGSGNPVFVLFEWARYGFLKPSDPDYQSIMGLLGRMSPSDFLRIRSDIADPIRIKNKTGDPKEILKIWLRETTENNFYTEIVRRIVG